MQRAAATLLLLEALFSRVRLRRSRAMPRFFFSRMCPDHAITDVTGEELHDRAEATTRAREIAMELAAEQLERGEGPAGWIEVEDEAHRPIFMLPLRAIAS